MANEIVPRKRDFAFEEAGIPKHWMGDFALGTQMANVLNLIFPMGERFFVRSVRYYMKEIEKDPALLARVRGFCQQEGHHAHAHEKFFDILRGQGYDIDGFLTMYQRVAWDLLEPKFAPHLRLSVTVALEHYTALFAERALGPDLFADAPNVMRDLLRWHAAEEIEHKDVAFDVLAAVDPRYSTRIFGLVLATMGLLGFWIAGTVMMMKQEKLGTLGVLKQLAFGFTGGKIANGDMRRAFLSYLRRDFHPSQIANDHLAQFYLANLAR
jgi:predicted metal-dependent hydrolase